MARNRPDSDDAATDGEPSDRSTGTGLVLGLAMGLALGVVLEDIPFWLAIGAGLGLAFEAADRRGNL